MGIYNNTENVKVLGNNVFEWDFNNDYTPSDETIAFFEWERSFFTNEFHTPPFHYFMVDALYNADFTTKVFECFRGGAKSTLINTKSFLYWCYLGYKPNYGLLTYVMFASASLKLIVGHIEAIKETIENNPRLSAVLEVIKVNIDAYPFIKIYNKVTGTTILMEGKSPSQKVRGMRKGEGQRAQMLMLDDAESEESVRNQEAINNFNSWLDASIYPALVAKRPEVIIIGTPLDYKSMLEAKKNSQFSLAVRVPACRNFNPEVITRPEDCAWADNLGGEELLAKYNFMKTGTGVLAFYQEYLLRMGAGEATVFDTGLVQYYDNSKPFDKEVFRYVSLDASTGISNGDYGAFVCIAVDLVGNWYVEDIVVGRFDVLETRDMAYKLCKRYDACLVTEAGVIYQMLLPMIEQKQRDDNYYFDILPIKRNTSDVRGIKGNPKINVFKRLLPRLEAKKLFLPEKSHFEEGKGWLLEQMESVTEKRTLSKHDDVIDALAQLELLEEASVPEYTVDEFERNEVERKRRLDVNNETEIVLGYN